MKHLRFLFMLLSILILVSCKTDSPKTISDVSFFGDHVIEYQIGVDEIEKYQIEVFYEDGSIELITLQTKMIINYTSEIFESVGLKNISIYYEGFEDDVTFKVFESELDSELLDIYVSALSEGASTLTYQEWLESIKGEDGIGITSIRIDYRGHLIVNYTDLTFSDLGRIVGQDGLNGVDGVDGVDGKSIEDFYIVNFCNIAGFIINTQIVIDGGSAIGFTPDLGVGYNFIEWDTDFSNVTENMNILPLYDKETYTISLIDEFNTFDDIEGVQYGDTTQLPKLTKEGNKFLGWYSGETLIDDNAIIKSDLTLTSRWEIEVYTIEYVTYDGTNVSTSIHSYGSTIGKPANPVNGDIYLEGWFTDETFEDEFVWDTMPAQDIILYAKWVDYDYYISSNSNPVSIVISGYNSDYDSIKIPEMINGVYVRTISAEAFMGANFSYVDLPDSINAIGELAFSNNPNLKEFIFPNAVSVLKNSTLANNPSLETVVLPNAANEVPVGFLINSISLKSVTFPDSITIIRGHAFDNSGIESLDINQVGFVDDHAFYNSSIITLTATVGLYKVGSAAFANCINLTSIPFYKHVRTIMTNAFVNTPSITAYEIHPDNTDFTTIDGVLYNKNTTELISYPGGKTDAVLTVQSNTTVLSGSSLNNNQYLEVINIPDLISSNSWEYETFSIMPALREINVFSTGGTPVVASIDGILYNSDFSILYRCPEAWVTSALTLPVTVTALHPEAFLDNQNITSIVLNEGLINIGYRSLSRMDQLSNINLPSTLTHIDFSAFQDSDLVTTLAMPDGIEYIGYGAFSDMDGLSTLTLNEGLTTLVPIIQNTPNLNYLHIPSTVTYIHYDIFEGTMGLTSVTLDSGNTSYQMIDDVIYNYDLTELFAYPLYKNDSSFTIPNTVQTVSANFFNNQYLNEIIFSSNVRFGGGNFSKLPNLQRVYLERELSLGIMFINNYTFNPDQNITYYIPSECYDLYYSATYWNSLHDNFVAYDLPE